MLMPPCLGVKQRFAKFHPCKLAKLSERFLRFGQQVLVSKEFVVPMVLEPLMQPRRPPVLGDDEPNTEFTD